MRIFALWLLILINLNVNATNYYFSSSTGNDSRTVAQAQNPATPWQTLTKLNSFFSNLNPGDSILFKRGETFYGEIIVNKSGTIAFPINISGYGAGSKPVITGFQTLSGWTSIGGGLWEITNVALRSTLNMVTINGIVQPMGRWPNGDAANKGYRTYQTHNANLSITDNTLPASPNWSGATVVVRTNSYTIDRAPILSQSNGTITYMQSGWTYQPTNGYGYYIQGDIRTLDQLGEWYYNGNTKKLTMYFGSNNPASYTIKAAAVDTLFNMQTTGSNILDNIVVNGLSFQGANTRAINFYTVRNGFTKVLNCDIQYIGIDGVVANGTNKNLTVDNCTLSDINNIGIVFTGTTDVNVTNNILRRIAMYPGMAGTADGHGAIHVRNISNSNVSYNTIDSVGYLGIQIGGADNQIIRRNFLEYYCMTLDDGGAIYGYSGAATAHSGNRVVSNTIMNGSSAIEGTTASPGRTSGIYYDNNVNGVVTDSNNVLGYNNLSGIFLHNNYNITVRYNKFFNAGNDVIKWLHDASSSNFRSMVINNNEVIARDATQRCMQVQTDQSDADVRLYGAINNNWYARPIDDNLTIRTATSGGATNRNLAGWVTYSGYDAASSKSPRSISNVSQFDVEYNPTSSPQNVTLGASYVDVKNAAYSGTITLQPYTSLILINVGSLITPTITWSNPAAITFGTALSGTQLNATFGGVAGTAVYSPAAGVIPNAGTNTLTVTFTPSNQAIYATTTKQVTIVVNPASATLSYSNMSQTWDGTFKQPTVTTSPAGLGVINTTLNGSSALQSNAGTYTAVSGLNNPNYVASTITATFTILPASSSISLSGLAQPYDGNPKPVTVVTTPAGLSYTVTYAGSFTPPSAVGSYAIVVHNTDPNHTATDATGTLVISVSGAAVTITNTNQTYDGTPKPVTVTTNPAGLTYDIFYSDVSTPPTDAGSYDVVATLNDGTHTGSASTTLIINKADPVITWPNPAAIQDGTQLSGVQLNATANVAGSMAYSPGLNTILPPGTQFISVTFTPTDTANYNTVTASVPLTIIANPFQNYWIEKNGKTFFENLPGQ